MLSMKTNAGARIADILLVSNGFGETAIATYVARALRTSDPTARVELFPLVGRAPADAFPFGVGPQADMPSGGLIAYWNVRNLARDVAAGLGGLTVRQYAFLRSQRQRDVIVAVGDIFCLAMCLSAAKRPTIFVATAKSDRVAPHSRLECAIARGAAAAFTRDEPTAASLRAAGVRAQYAGNIMMDGVALTGQNLGRRHDAIVFAVLPGSRADAPASAAAQIERLRRIASLLGGRGRTVQAFFSIAPSVDASALQDAIKAAGFELSEISNGDGVVAQGMQANLEIALVRGAFGDMLAAADIVLGQAGTANEQAAGLGKPVIAAAQAGEAPDRMLWYRMRQKRLLGEALLVLPAAPSDFAAEVVRLIDDPSRMRHMAQVGRERMGDPGGAAAVAALALSIGGD